MRIVEACSITGLLLLTACAVSTTNGPGETKLAKTIPKIYHDHTDPRIRSIHDTMFLDRTYFTGFIVGFFPSGDTAFIRGYFNGVPEGRQLAWSQDRVLIESGFFINGKKEGLQQTWWPDGRPQLRYQTTDNVYEGSFLEWNRAGILIKQFNYSKGQEVGRQRLWWDNGTVRANYEIRNGRKYGLIGLKLCANSNDSIR